jgi:hypothetical protein
MIKYPAMVTKLLTRRMKVERFGCDLRLWFNSMTDRYEFSKRVSGVCNPRIRFDIYLN